VRASAKASAARSAVPGCKSWVGGAVGEAGRLVVPRGTDRRPSVHPSQSAIFSDFCGFFWVGSACFF